VAVTNEGEESLFGLEVEIEDTFQGTSYTFDFGTIGGGLTETLSQNFTIKAVDAEFDVPDFSVGPVSVGH